MRISNKRHAQLRLAIALALCAIAYLTLMLTPLILLPAIYGCWMFVDKYKVRINRWVNAPTARTHYAPRKQLLLRNAK